MAVSNGVADLATVSSSGFASTIVVTSGPPLPKDSKLTDGQIAGIVIGVLIGSVAIAGLVYYLINVRRANAGFNESLIQEGGEASAAGGGAMVSRDLEASGDSFMLANDKNDSSYIDSAPAADDYKPEESDTVLFASAPESAPAPEKEEGMQVVIQSDEETRL